MEPPPELLQHRAAAAVVVPRLVEPALHREQVSQDAQEDRLGSPIGARRDEELAAALLRGLDGRGPVQDARSDRGQEPGLEGGIARPPRVIDHPGRGLLRRPELPAREVELQEQSPCPREPRVVAELLQERDRPPHLVEHDPLGRLRIGGEPQPKVRQPRAQLAGPVARRARLLDRGGERRLGGGELPELDVRLAREQAEPRSLGVLRRSQRRGSLEQVRRRRHVAAGEGPAARGGEVAGAAVADPTARGRRRDRAGSGSRTPPRGGSRGSPRTRSRARRRRARASRRTARAARRASA